MRAFDIAIYMLCLNLGIGVFSLMFSLSGSNVNCKQLAYNDAIQVSPGLETNPGCKLILAVPEDMLIISQQGTVDTDGRTWNESINYYSNFNYTGTVESEAEAQTSTWGSVLIGLQVLVGVIKMGVFGVFIMINAILREAGLDQGTRWAIAGIFQTGTYAIYTIGLSQYIRGSGMKGYE